MEPIKLTKAERQAFRDNEACNAACEKIIQKAIRHWELAHIERQVIWEELTTKYQLDVTQQHRFDPVTGTVTSYVRLSEKAQDIADDLEARLALKERIAKVFKNKK